MDFSLALAGTAHRHQPHQAALLVFFTPDTHLHFPPSFLHQTHLPSCICVVGCVSFSKAYGLSVSVCLW